MDANNLTMKDVPRDFMSETGRTLANYSIALGIWEDGKAKKFRPIGSGVLVRKGSRFGILTARHCLHKPGPEIHLGPIGKDVLCVVLQRGRGVLMQPQDVIEHQLVTPQSIEYGPDLAFIEITSGERLSSIKAISSFWSLDKNPVEVAENFGKLGMLLATTGFPGVHYNTRIDAQAVRHQIRHMAYYFLIGPGDVYERDGWDYIENQCDISSTSELPSSFKGMSGGPMWSLHFEVDEKHEKFKLTEFALVGISFFEVVVEDKERKIRAHYIKSIYDFAWKNFTT